MSYFISLYTFLLLVLALMQSLNRFFCRRSRLSCCWSESVEQPTCWCHIFLITRDKTSRTDWKLTYFATAM